MEYDFYLKHMLMIQDVFETNLADSKLEVYWIALQGLSEKEFSNACSGILQHYKYNKFPLPAVFFEYAGQSPDDLANMAVSRLKKAILSVGQYESVSFGDLALHSVIMRFGGWGPICAWGYDDWKINEGRFIAAYKSAVICKDKGPEYLPGIHELQNRGKAFDEWIKKPKLIGNNGRAIGFVRNDLQDKLHIEAKE